MYDVFSFFDAVEPRKTVTWRGTGSMNNVRVEQVKTDSGVHLYVIGDLAHMYGDRVISDFSLLVEVIKIGCLFESISLFDLPHIETVKWNCQDGINAIIDFVERNGVPYLSENLQNPPVFERERLQNLTSDEFLDETNAWQPRDGCSIAAIIAASKTLYSVWNFWAQMQMKPAESIERKQAIEQLNTLLVHSGWTYQIAGVDVFHTPQLTHVLRYNEILKQYQDIYESRNLFCILFDQLYSFIVDFDSGAYPKVKECPVCGRGFISKRNQRYCANCGDLVKSRGSTERSRRYRENNPKAYERQKQRQSEKRRGKSNAEQAVPYPNPHP